MPSSAVRPSPVKLTNRNLPTMRFSITALALAATSYAQLTVTEPSSDHWCELTWPFLWILADSKEELTGRGRQFDQHHQMDRYPTDHFQHLFGQHRSEHSGMCLSLMTRAL